MKKIVLSLFLTSLLFSSDFHYERRIYTTFLDALFPHKTLIKVWSDSQEKQQMLASIQEVKIVKEKKDADILIINKPNDIVKNKIIFVTNYPLLKTYEGWVIGGFYWKKGRPNIIFLKKNLLKKHLSLPLSFNDFIEDEL